MKDTFAKITLVCKWELHEELASTTERVKLIKNEANITGYCPGLGTN